MLDTNICIDIARGRPPRIRERFAELAPGEAVISVITWGELRCGAERSAQRESVVQSLDEYAALVPVEPLAEAAGGDGWRAVGETLGPPPGRRAGPPEVPL